MKMPVLFIGHGSPMNALQKNAWTQALENLGQSIPKPTAIVCVSAHWMTKGLKILNTSHPKTIHDFGNFPEALYQVQYPALGNPELAHKIFNELKIFNPQLDKQWGLDHGTWSILLHMFPKADIPVVQLSLDLSLAEKAHLEIGKALRSFREEGILILGSGNIVHNLRKIKWNQSDSETYPWALEFDSSIATALKKRDEDSLIFHKQKFGESSQLSVPTDEHYWPLLYCYGASDANDQVSFPYEGFEMGSLSMRAVMWS